jgi:hypothetical protein
VKTWWILGAILSVLLMASACSPAARPAASPRPTARAAPAPTATADPARTALAIVPMRIDETPLPPPEPTPVGFAAGRPTPTPDATPDVAWKYVTIIFAVENRSDQVRLVGIAGSDPSSTNLTGAVLTARDGTRYRAFNSSSSFGLRTASSRTLTNYPVLLRLPPGYRAAAESYGTQSVVAPDPSSLTFRLPASMTDYGTLTIPPLTNLGPKTDDQISAEIRPLLGGFQPLDMSGMHVGQQNVSFPFASPPTGMQPLGSPVTGSASLALTLVSVDAASPPDFEARNRGFKLVTLAVRYRNGDPQQAHSFNLAAWLFGVDGVVYTGDAPSIGDIGRSLTPPDPAAILLWDGRIVASDPVAAGQETEPRGLVFQVPRALPSGVLIFGGDVEAAYQVDNIAVPPAP